jgi:hypothetical protein
MKNQVIKCLTPEHGKKILDYWKSKGVDTSDKTGTSCESDNHPWIYYGVISGRFENYSYNDVKFSNAEIIELPDEFDMTTTEGRLAYAKKHYPVGTKYRGLKLNGDIESSISKVLCTPKDNQYGNIDAGPHWIYLYKENKWAEIVEKVKEEETESGRLAYAKKHYPVGTKYKSLYSGQELIVGSYDGHLCLQPEGIWSVYDFLTNKWAEIIDEVKEEIVMQTQRLSRQGLKEIHSVACSSWKSSLELLGTNNPLEDYIELNQDQVDAMFKACTATQLPIVSKYLKQDDGSVDISKVTYDENGTRLNDVYVVRHNAITSITKGFWLNPDFNWEVKMISDTPFLVPTKKKSKKFNEEPYAYGTASGVSQSVGSTTATVGRMDF